jgi:hypothetical protein
MSTKLKVIPDSAAPEDPGVSHAPSLKAIREKGQQGSTFSNTLRQGIADALGGADSSESSSQRAGSFKLDKFRTVGEILVDQLQQLGLVVLAMVPAVILCVLQSGMEMETFTVVGSKLQYEYLWWNYHWGFSFVMFMWHWFGVVLLLGAIFHGQKECENGVPTDKPLQLTTSIIIYKFLELLVILAVYSTWHLLSTTYGRWLFECVDPSITWLNDLLTYTLSIGCVVATPIIYYFCVRSRLSFPVRKGIKWTVLNWLVDGIFVTIARKIIVYFFTLSEVDKLIMRFVFWPILTVSANLIIAFCVSQVTLTVPLDWFIKGVIVVTTSLFSRFLQASFNTYLGSLLCIVISSGFESAMRLSVLKRKYWIQRYLLKRSDEQSQRLVYNQAQLEQHARHEIFYSICEYYGIFISAIVVPIHQKHFRTFRAGYAVTGDVDVPLLIFSTILGLFFEALTDVLCSVIGEKYHHVPFNRVWKEQFLKEWKRVIVILVFLFCYGLTFMSESFNVNPAKVSSNTCKLLLVPHML